MRDVAPVLAAWLRDPGPLALATVVGTWGSSPRRPGARMVVDGAGRITGSVSGGCVEASVVEAAREVMATGTPRLAEYKVTDQSAWEVGLACGGALEVLVARPEPAQVEAVLAALAEREAVAWVTALDGTAAAVVRADGTVVGDPGLGARGGAALADGQPVRLEGAFCDVILPEPTLVMVGGVHIAQALSALSATVGVRPVVCDPRPVFASPERFPGVELVHQWPREGLAGIGLDAGTAVATLTHDPKLDDPALLAALSSPAFYVGALGSRRTHAKRAERLREQGMSEERLARLRAPIGLAIGARTPEQIALSVLAEVVAARNGATCYPPSLRQPPDP